MVEGGGLGAAVWLECPGGFPFLFLAAFASSASALFLSSWSPPPPHSVLALAALSGLSPHVMSRMRRSSYNYVHSKDYELGKEWKQRAMVDLEDRLFLEGMLRLMRLEGKRNNHLVFRELTGVKGRVHYTCYTPSTDVQFSSSIDSSDSDSSHKSESGSSPKTKEACTLALVR